MNDDTLFERPPPIAAGRAVNAGQPSWVAVWGTRMALVNAADEATVRERVRAQCRVHLNDDEISVRRATSADLALVDEVDGGSQVRLTDWKYGLTDTSEVLP